jgi:protein phosphatase
VTAVLARDSELAFVSVGDSRIYRWRDGVLTQLTADDSWVSYARRRGADITDEEALHHPMRHVLTEVVGIRGELMPELQAAPLAAGDTLLLCSDGLHGVMTPELIAAALTEQPDPEAAAQRLVDEAIARGSTDNVTALVIRKLA